MFVKPNSLRLQLRILSSCFCQSQRRNVFLLFAAKTKQLQGNHKMKPFGRISPPILKPPAILPIEVGTGEGIREKKLGLSDVINSHIRPGLALYRDPPSHTEEDGKPHTRVPKTTSKPYSLIELRDDKELRAQKRKKPISMKGRGTKQVHLSTFMDLRIFKHAMDLAYNFMILGYPVEVHVNATNGKKWCTIDWTLENQLHLNPNAILRAMPAGSFYNIRPRTDGLKYCWVMSTEASGCGDWDGVFENRRLEMIRREDGGVEPPRLEYTEPLRKDAKMKKEGKRKEAKEGNRVHDEMMEALRRKRKESRAANQELPPLFSKPVSSKQDKFIDSKKGNGLYYGMVNELREKRRGIRKMDEPVEREVRVEDTESFKAWTSRAVSRRPESFEADEKRNRERAMEFGKRTGFKDTNDHQPRYSSFTIWKPFSNTKSERRPIENLKDSRLWKSRENFRRKVEAQVDMIKSGVDEEAPSIIRKSFSAVQHKVDVALGRSSPFTREGEEEKEEELMRSIRIDESQVDVVRRKKEEELMPIIKRVEGVRHPLPPKKDDDDDEYKEWEEGSGLVRKTVGVSDADFVTIKEFGH